MGFFAALSSSQRGEFMARLRQTERHYDHLLRYQQERQGPHLAALSAADIQSMHENGQPSRQAPDQIEASTEALFESCNLMESVRAAEAQAKKEFDNNVEAQRTLLSGGASAFSSSQIVNIAGYPFLLQIPSRFALPYEKRLEGYLQLRRYQNIHSHLITMIGLARDYPGSYLHYASSSSAARHTAVAAAAAAATGGLPAGYHGAAPAGLMLGGGQPPAGLGALAIGAQQAARLAGPGHPTARLAIVINIDEILALVFPLLFLSAKLGFLIYIFGRHASNAKRAVMVSMAVLWIVWEGIAIRRRRRALEARRLGLARQGQNVQAAMNARRPLQGGAENGPARQGGQQQQQPGHEQAQAADPAAMDGQGEGQADPLLPPAMQQLRERQEQRIVRRGHRQAGPGGPASTSTRISSHRPPPNRLSPKYWMQCVARVGLSAEARELGISRSASSSSAAASSSSSQAIISPPATDAVVAHQQMTWERALRNVWICFVLFFGTLVPEIERMRRKSLEKRNRKLAELEVARNAVAAQGQSGSQGDVLEGSAQRNTSVGEGVAGTAMSGGGGGDVQHGAQADIVATNATSSSSADAIQAGHAPDAAVATASGQPSQLDGAFSSGLDGNQPSHTSSPGGMATPLRLNELGLARTESDTELDRDLFDPPFDDAALAAALAGQGQSMGGSGMVEAEGSGSRSTGAGLGSGLGSRLGPGEAESMAVTSALNLNEADSRADTDRDRDGNGVGVEYETRPLPSPGEPEGEGEGELLDMEEDEEGDGVDDEVGMWVACVFTSWRILG